MVFSTSNNGIKRRLIISHSLIMVDKDESLSFEITDAKLKLGVTINFTFSDYGPENTTSGSLDDNGRIINMTLFRWDNSLGIEVTQPIEYTTKSGKRIWIKFRTFTNAKSFRTFHLTVWGEE